MTYQRPSIEQALVRATLLMVPLFALPVALYCVVHDADIDVAFGAFTSIPYGVALLAGIVVHEWLHGAGFHYFAGIAWADIKFGVMWKYLTPYASALVPMAMRPYRWAAALPGIVLGAVPSIVAIAIGSPMLLSFGAVMFCSAAGDFYVLLQSRQVPADALILDSPDSIGFDIVG
jgi:hypothetical protein